MNYLLDTNVISELIIRTPNQKVIDWIDSLTPETVYLSVITIGEFRLRQVSLMFGKLSSRGVRSESERCLLVYVQRA
jgi:predicted nucleic acid-binding protein